MLVVGRPTTPALPGVSLTRWQHRLTVVAPAVLAAYFFASNARGAWRSAHEWGHFAPRPPLYGLYDVDAVVRGGVTQSLVPQDSTLWSRVAIGQLRSTIRLTSGTLGFYVAAVDTVAHTIRFKSRDDSSTFVFSYERPDTNRLVLRGRLGPDSVSLSLRRRHETAYRLVSHRFDWTHNTNANR